MKKKSTPRIVRAYQLKKGDRFSYIPAAWFGPGVVTESYGDRVLLPNEAFFSGVVSADGKHRVSGTWTIKFDNKKVVNPPGVEYCNPETKFRLLSRRTRNNQTAGWIRVIKKMGAGR